MSQAITPVKDRQQNLEESIVMPMINKWLKIKGALMAPNEIQDIITNGASPKWIKLTKGILTGKMTIYDMLTAGLLTEEELIEMEKVMLDQGILPDEEIVVDTDWIVSVETGSMAEVDKAQDLENFDGWIQFNQQLGVPVDAEKVSIERAMKAGIKDPEQYIQKINPMANVQIGMNQPANPMGQPMPVGM
jgi:hypothetical protein